MTRTIHRFRLAAVCLGLVALAFLQEPGRVVADTKLDLTADPAGLLARALHLWDGSGFFGQVQNQAYGYLWPVGPFFAGLNAVGVAPWVAQRLWWSVLLVVAFLGFVRVARHLGVCSPSARILAGLGYVLSGRVLSELGTISVESWPMAVAPWILLPLVIGSTRGSPRRWAALSGLAFVMVGGVNAVATVAVLPLAGWWLLTRTRGPRTWSLIGWWSVALGLASLWWVVPLLLLGRYSPPFLDWIESASVTTSHNDPTSVLRGASHWVPYLVDTQGPIWPAGWRLVNSPMVVAAMGVVALVGVLGLTLRRVPERAYLVIVLSTGLVLTALGHVSANDISGWGAAGIRELLDAGLAPLRNVHKFQPLVTFPLLVGVGHALQALQDRLAGASAPWLASAPQVTPRALVVPAAAAVLVVAALPAFTGGIGGGRSHIEIPDYWRDTADWVNANSGGRALVIPAASFGAYMWGRTQDEPLQVLGTQSWGVRDAVPLSSAGNIRWLDEIERRLDAGTGSAGLAPALARAGVRYLVVRNDLDQRATGAVAPVLVHQALAQSPGIRRVARFGPVLEPYGTTDTVIDEGLNGSFPAVEVFQVETDPATTQGRVALRDASSVIAATGAAEAMIDLADSGLADGRPVILASDPVPEVSVPRSVVTDTFRRAEANFGAVHRQYSQTAQADDEFIAPRPVHDYLPVEPEGQQAIAQLEGAPSVSASSSGSSPFALRGRSPAAQPWAAVDGDPSTAWISGDLQPGVGQWWQLDLGEPVDMSTLGVRLLRDPRVGARPAAVTVTTSSGSTVLPVEPTGELQLLTVPGASRSTILRLTLAAVDGGGAGQGFGIAEVDIPGVQIRRPVRTVPATAEGGLVLAARSMGREGCASVDTSLVCTPQLANPGEERAGIDRIVDVGLGGTYRVEARFRPNPGAALDQYLRAPRTSIQVRASTQSSSDPAVRAQAAADSLARTTWTASPLDERPTLALTLPTRRRISGLSLQVSPDAPASRPLAVDVRINGLNRAFILDERGEITFDPVRTDQVELTFGAVSPVRSRDSIGATRVLPVGVTEVVLRGAQDLQMNVPASAAVTVPCGFGPVLTVDGAPVGASGVTTTAGDILSGALADSSDCDQVLTLDAGLHRIRMEPTQEWTVERLYLKPVTRARVTPMPAPQIRSWGPARREVQVRRSAVPGMLETTENFNPGWSARLGDTELSPYRVDGWRQGFLVPAGASGTVELTYGPDRLYRGALLVGLLVALLLLPLALVRDGGPHPAPVGPGRSRLVGVVLPLLGAGLIGGTVGALAACALVALVARTARGSRRRALITARSLGAAAAGAALLAQVLQPWPDRVGVGAAYDWLMVLGPALVLGALVSVRWATVDAPSAAPASRPEAS